MSRMPASQGAYKKGKDKRNQILDVARDLLIDEGYHNFSLRKVAEKAGIRVGNLQYYFPAKSDLVKAMLDHVIKDYLQDFDNIRGTGTPEQQFIAVIEDVVTDLNTRKTTVFFPELWSLSNHEKGITRSMAVDMERGWDQRAMIGCLGMSVRRLFRFAARNRI